MPLQDVGVRSLNRGLADEYIPDGPDSINSILSGCSHLSLESTLSPSGPPSHSSLPSTSLSSHSTPIHSTPNKKSSRFCPDMGTSKYELEDYIYDMECREAGVNPPGVIDDETQDIYTRLAKKEQDLILAAELGKALLERNEVLVQENEKISEHYGQQLEILEQEKHLLRRKFVSKEGEYEVKIQELAVDLQIAKHELEDQQESLRQTEKEKGHVLEELTEQTQRLTKQLKESSKREESMNQEISRLREQFSLRKANMSDQVSTLEMLKEEINLLAQKKYDLEVRIESLSQEREGLSVTLDESTDRILMLERQSREKEQIIRSSQRDLEDLRHNNLSLTDRLEALSRNSSSPSMGHTSLMNEMDLSDQDASRRSLQEDLLELDEDIECDEPILAPVSDAEALKQLRSEILESTSQLRSLVDQMRHQRRNSLTSISTNSSDELVVNQVKPGLLKEVVKELQGLIRQLLLREAKGLNNSSGLGSEERLHFETETHKALEAVDKLNIELSDRKDKLKAKTEEAEHLSQQLMLKDVQMKATEEERDNLKFDLENTHLAKDELIKKAWDMRDNAVARKNTCEIELARTRIDVMQVNSQLMEAIQQKIELSQQLEQWQVDMQQLLDDQMKSKLERLENSGVLSARPLNGHDSDSSSSSKNSPKKTFKIFALLSHLRRSAASATTTNNSTENEK